MKTLRFSPSPSTVIAILALAIAVAGNAVVAQANANTSQINANTPAVFTQLKLKNGWTGGPFRTSNPAAALISGIVHFKGAMASSGSNSLAFILPAKFRPGKPVFVQVGMCDGTAGRLVIATNGITTVQAENDFRNATCLTSLDGASFAR
jgi:hypothetical protein